MLFVCDLWSPYKFDPQINLPTYKSNPPSISPIIYKSHPEFLLHGAAVGTAVEDEILGRLMCHTLLLLACSHQKTR